MLFLQLGDRGEVYSQQKQDGQCPANGPNQIQKAQAVGLQGEDGVDPNKPQQTQEKQGGNRGGHGLAKAAQCAGHDLVDAAEEVCGCGNHDLLTGEIHHAGAGGHDGSQSKIFLVHASPN